MKLKLILISILLSCASSVHATLIDLTPGGFSLANGAPPPPPAYFKLLRDWNLGVTNLIAGANIIDNTVIWSPFTLFGQDNFAIDPHGPIANVSWNMANTGDYFMQYVWLTGTDGREHIYRVGGLSRFVGDGTVIIDGFDTITSIVFMGHITTVPDGGTTLLLFALALAILFIAARRLETRYNQRHSSSRTQ